MKFTEKIIFNISKLKRKMKILLIDGNDKRAQEAALRLKNENLAEITLLVNEETEKNNLTFLNMNDKNNLKQEFINEFLEFRKGKETEESAKKAMETRPVYASMLLRRGYFDAVVGGLLYPTSDILRAGFKCLGPKKGIKTISSIMIMHKNEEAFLFTDISVQPKPNLEQLTEIGLNAANAAKNFDIKDSVAFLSFSTAGSVIMPETELVSQATKLFNEKYEGTKAIGEVQFDAAFDMEVRKSKYGQSPFEGKPGIYVFPDLGSANIGYKLVQRFGNYGAIGPIIVGSSKVINDLSRGATVDDVYYTIITSALQASYIEKGKNN